MKWLAAAAALASAGCGQEAAVIDGSSDPAFAASVETARRDLPVADRLAFDRALKAPPGRRFGDSDLEVARQARAAYDGMTAAQVVEMTR